MGKRFFLSSIVLFLNLLPYLVFNVERLTNANVNGNVELMVQYWNRVGLTNIGLVLDAVSPTLRLINSYFISNHFLSFKRQVIPVLSSVRLVTIGCSCRLQPLK